MTEHMQEYLDLSRLAHVAGMNPSYFIRAFKKVRGSTPMQELRRLRRQRARRLLTTTDLTLQVIAEQIGLRHAFHLSRVFKQTYSLSPQQLRDQHH